MQRLERGREESRRRSVRRYRYEPIEPKLACIVGYMFMLGIVAQLSTSTARLRTPDKALPHLPPQRLAPCSGRLLVLLHLEG